MKFLVYLELNPVERIIENINHSVMVVKAIMLCMSLKQILFFSQCGNFPYNNIAAFYTGSCLSA